MVNSPSPQGDPAELVDRMFGEVLTDDERADLLTWFRAWEAENPQATSAERVTGWIDVAYAYQERGASRASWRPREHAPANESAT